jgi:thiamine-phosphate pyrophosphorylase
MTTTTPAAMPTDRTRLAGVYLLTPDARGRAFDDVLRVVEQALAAGVRVVQYRNKLADAAERERQARGLVALVRSAGALAIVNDRPELAAAVGADGVHIGRDDSDVRAARALLPDGLVGVSCYDEAARAAQAVADGADAVAFGSMFPSPTKPHAVRAPLELLGKALVLWPTRRVIAIGGIDHGNIHEVAQAGAHAAALISAVFDAADPKRAAAALVRLFNEGHERHESQRAAV